MGRVRKMDGDPRDMVNDWRKAVSNISPKTRASIRGAAGKGGQPWSRLARLQLGGTTLLRTSRRGF